MAIVRVRYPGADHDAKLRRDYTRPPWKIQIAVIEVGTPVEPDDTRKLCGTDVVWPVLRVIDPPGKKLIVTPYVCRHEIEGAD